MHILMSIPETAQKTKSHAPPFLIDEQNWDQLRCSCRLAFDSKGQARGQSIGNRGSRGSSVWIRRKGNPRRVFFSEERVGVVEPVLVVHVRDVGRPQILCRRATLTNPIRERSEYMSAELPVDQILRAADSELTAVRRFASGEYIPGFSTLDERRVVGSRYIACKGVNVRQLEAAKQIPAMNERREIASRAFDRRIICRRGD